MILFRGAAFRLPGKSYKLTLIYIIHLKPMIMKKMLLVLAAVAMVSATISGQVTKKFTEATTDPGPAAGTVWDTGDGCSMFFFDTNDIVKANTAITIGSETFEFSCQGKNNPKPWEHQALGAAAMWLFDVTVDGALSIAVAINKTKRTYFAECPIVANKADDFTYVLCGEEGVSDYLYTNETEFRDGATFVGGIIGDTAMVRWPNLVDPANTWIFVPITIPVKAGKCYTLFCTGSKMAMYGFTYTAGGTVGLDGVVSSRRLLSTTYYNLAGKEVKNFNAGSQKGVYLVKNVMSDGTVDVQKLMIR